MTPNALTIVAVVLAVLGGAIAVAGLVALFRLRVVSATARLLLAALLLSIGALLGALGVGVHGYRALTHETLAARIDIEPLGAQRFSARFRYPDGTTTRYDLSGDEIYVDAHILKWTPWANFLGLRTGYSLSRVAGRYRDIEQERNAPRTVFALTPDQRVDLFTLRRRFAQLAPLYDAEYGSASFVPADRMRSLELRVSTTGLLVRDAEAPK